MPAAAKALKFATSALVMAAAAAAYGGPQDRYAVITLVNETPYRVDYSYGWGGNGETNHNNHVLPNSKYAHWWTFSYPGQDYAPWLYIELDGQTSPVRLRSFYAPKTEAEYGRVYYIRFEDSQFKVYGKLYSN